VLNSPNTVFLAELGSHAPKTETKPPAQQPPLRRAKNTWIKQVAGKIPPRRYAWEMGLPPRRRPGPHENRRPAGRRPSHSHGPRGLQTGWWVLSYRTARPTDRVTAVRTVAQLRIFKKKGLK
jgi:hypothetical protein